jgi:hypothetical protein
MTQPYVNAKPGDLVTADYINGMQQLIREDIDKVATAKAKEITHVAEADDAAKLSGNTLEQVIATVTDRVLERISAQQGYLRLFKVLPPGPSEQFTVVRHGLGRIPLVDLYQLDQFQTVCSEDDSVSVGNSTFYLHNTNEKQLKTKDDTGKTVPVDVQPRRGTPWRIPFADMLNAYKVSYSPDTNLGDLENDFWEAFFAAPNDEFGDDQYCHSPWFDRCCGERRTVSDLQRGGDWDDIWFQMRPRKTIYATAAKDQEPANIGITHFDLDTVGLERFDQNPGEVPIMALLKC